MAMEKPCTLLIFNDKGEPPQLSELKTALENGSDEQKIDALKKVVMFTLNGEQLNQVLMPIIRFVTPSRDHTIKKLLLLYWEVVEKTNADGKLKSEMILVCNALRNDLTHPNEYIRGSTLRLVCKLKEPEVLEPLLPTVRSNLDHRHSYVRKNAVLAVYSIYKNFDYLIPDAPELIYNFLLNEADASCKRNAFIMLFNCAQEKAVEYLGTVLDQVSNFGDVLQFIVVELIRKVCRTNPNERSKYMKCIFTLLQSSSSAVQYESAGTLLSLSSAPTAVRASASTYINLLCNESDNNVKMIVLDRLLDIKKNHSKVLQDLLMDILRALATPTLEIRRKTLDIALDLVTTKNIDEVILVLKKEINKTQAKEYEKGGEYRQMLIQAIHQCAVKFPDVASNVVHMLMDFLGDSNVASAMDVITFVREVVETYPNLREAIVRKLLESLFQIKSEKVYRASLWIIGEYCRTPEDIEIAMSTLRESLGELPLVSTIQTDSKDKDAKDKPVPPPSPAPVSVSTRVLADGTYATQSAFTEVPASTQGNGILAADNNQQLRSLLSNGDFFLGTVLASTLTKLALRATELDIEPRVRNAVHAEALYIITSVISFGDSATAAHPMDPDSRDRLNLCIRILADPSTPPQVKKVWTEQCHYSFSSMLLDQIRQKREDDGKKPKSVHVQADDLIKIRQLRGARGRAGPDPDIEDEDESDITKAAGIEKVDHGNGTRVYQLTGFSDPLYAEAVVHVHQYDIVLDVTILNQTNDTLQNVTLELATLGDLKLCERPQNYTIAPKERQVVKANIKVSSTETGIIFGNIVYDVAGVSSSDKNCVILSEIHIDIMDYISPATCTDVQFRSMWSDFEWENKVAVNTNFEDVNQFLIHIVKSTNMQCLTSSSALAGECAFLSANLYAKSVFGEDALVNVCVERTTEGRIAGYIRIRSKTQGIALSLGDKITTLQKRV
jgi:coatomer subunit beta